MSISNLKSKFSRVGVISSIVLGGVSFNAFSQLAPPVAPSENPVTENKRVLGKILFWDRQLSSNNRVSCGSCHSPNAGGADNRRGQHPGADGLFDSPDDVIGSPGIVSIDQNGNLLSHPFFGLNRQVTNRAAPTVIMAAYSQEQFWDGRAGQTFIDPVNQSIEITSGASLESQAIAPILNDVEMAQQNRQWQNVISKLETAIPLARANTIPQDMQSALAINVNYPALFNAAFGNSEITVSKIAMAIATYERTLIADQTPWDKSTI